MANYYNIWNIKPTFDSFLTSFDKWKHFSAEDHANILFDIVPKPFNQIV